MYHYFNVHFWVASPKLDSHCSGGRAFASYFCAGAPGTDLQPAGFVLQVQVETHGGEPMSNCSSPSGF